MSSEPGIAELERRITADVVRRRRAELDELGRHALLWLAVTPSWTWPLAEACSFPVDDLDAFVDRAVRAGICRVARAGRGGGDQELRLLAGLAEWLPAGLVEEALRLAAEADDAGLQASAVVALAPVAAQWGTVVECVSAIDRPGPRATAWAGIFGFLPEEERIRLLPEAVAAVLAVPRVDHRPGLLGELARCLPEEARAGVVPEIADAVDALSDPVDRATALVEVADLVPREVELDGLEEPADRARLRLDLIRRRPSRGLAARALEDARQVVDPVERDLLLLAVVQADPYVEGDLGIQDPQTRALAYGLGSKPKPLTLTQLLEGLADPATRVTVAATILASRRELAVVDLALRAAAELPDTAESAGPLAALASALEGAAAAPIIQRGLRAVAQIGEPARRIQAGLNFAPALPPDVLADYAATVNSIEDFPTRLRLLTRLVPLLDDPQRAQLIGDALRIVRNRGSADSFWMPDAVRHDVLAQLDVPESLLHKVVHDIASAVSRTRAQVPAPVQRWARFAQATAGRRLSAAGAARFLDHEVSRALTARDLPGALDWIDTAKLLAATLGNELEGSVRYAARRVELLYRQRQDARRAVPLLLLDEQVNAFEDLLADAGDAWALHYLGSGGVGKTTLLSHLIRSADEYEMAVGRVDFDYLTPDYPRERPGQLLLELMAELQLYARAGHEESTVAAFHQNVSTLHRTWNAVPASERPEPVDDPDFQALLTTFCDYLTLLGRRRVVIFLDTCEELVRWQPGDTHLPSVTATFTILETVRAMLDRAGVDLKVVFAGRRPLASGNGPGPGEWTVEGSVDDLPARPYLRVHEIRGFTEAQAREYLRRIRKLDVPAEVETEVLARSEQQQDARVLRTGEPRVDSPDEPSTMRVDEPSASSTGDHATSAGDRRYLPFDLALYADWLLADSTLTAEEIRSGGVDPYIDRRIVARVKSEAAKSLLPALALVHRADAPLLEAVFDGDHESFREAFEALADHEWIRRSAGPDPAARVELQFEPRMHDRLRAYYEHDDRIDELDRVRRDLVPVLEDRLDHRQLGELSPLLVDDALKLLPEDTAADHVHTLVLRAAAGARWDWIEELVRQLLGDNGLLGRHPRHPARPSAEAAHAAWLTHEGRQEEAQGFWSSVLTSAQLDNDGSRAIWLSRRALLSANEVGEIGQVLRQTQRAPVPMATGTTEPAAGARDSAGRDGSPGSAGPTGSAGPGGPPGSVGSSAIPLLRVEPEDLQLVASCCAALDRVADFDELREVSFLDEWLDDVERWELPPYLRAHVQLLRARMLAENTFALDVAEVIWAESEQVWLDLVVPDSMRDRIRLYRVALSVVSPVDDETMALWSDEATRTIDGERLRSAVLREQLARRPVSGAVAEELLEWDRFEVRPRPVCGVHRRTQPLFVSAAYALLSDGDPERALQVLGERLASAEDGDLETVRAAELATLHVLRRARIAAQRYLVYRCIRSDDREVREAALAVLALTAEPQEVQSLAPDEWQYQAAFGAGSRERLRALGEAKGWRTRADRRVGEELDRMEWRALTGVETTTYSVAFPSDPIASAQARLRLSAFDRNIRESIPEGLGPRRLGELAFEAGELMALRLPDRAAELLDLAVAWFRTAGDPLSAAEAEVCAAIAHAHARPDRLSESEGLELLGRMMEARRTSDELSTQLSPDPDPGERGPMRPGSSVFPAGMDQNGWPIRAVFVEMWAQGSRSADDASLPVEFQHGRYDFELPGRARRVPTTVVTGVAAVVGVAVATAVQVWSGQRLLAALGVSLAAVAVLVALPIGVVWFARMMTRTVTDLGRQGTAARIVVRAVGNGVVTVELRIREAGLHRREASVLESIRLMGDLYGAILARRPARLFDSAERVAATVSWQPGTRLGGLPVEVVRPLRELREAQGRTNLCVDLDVPLELAGLDWERAVETAVDGRPPLQPGSGPLYVSRVTSAPAGKLPPMNRRELSFGVVASSAWIRGADQVWSRVAEPLRASDELVRPTVFHAIGQPSRTGDWLEIPGDSVSSSSSAPAPGRRLTGDFLPGGTTLVVLQVEPYAIERRTATDRDAVAGLKQLAYGVHANGAWAVVVIPSLPPELATEVVTVIADTLRLERDRFYRLGASLVRKIQREDPLASRLREARRQAQAIVRGWDGWSEETPESLPVELADDICLYLRDGAVRS
ncbi:hypothetical protein [Kribbella sp. NPDC051770]|uniref:hypothetical protein n=1 Tax=Kribbella sp. NPDC051770 TaxID=3155413 RepID=UPI003414CC4F